MKRIAAFTAALALMGGLGITNAVSASAVPPKSRVCYNSYTQSIGWGMYYQYRYTSQTRSGCSYYRYFKGPQTFGRWVLDGHVTVSKP